MQTKNKNSNRIGGEAEGRGKFTLRRKHRITAAVKVSPSRWQIPTPAKNKHRWLTLGPCRLSLTCGKSFAAFVSSCSGWKNKKGWSRSPGFISYIKGYFLCYFIEYRSFIVLNVLLLFTFVWLIILWAHYFKIWLQMYKQQKFSTKKATFNQQFW